LFWVFLIRGTLLLFNLEKVKFVCLFVKIIVSYFPLSLQFFINDDDDDDDDDNNNNNNNI